MDINNPTEPGKEINQPENNENDMASFEDLLNEDFPTVNTGDKIQGVVAGITKDHVMLDIKRKVETPLPIAEFLDENGECIVSVGDTVDVLVTRFNPEDGSIRISYAKLIRDELIRKLENSLKNKELCAGIVKAKVKGGLSIMIGGESGIKAFMPFSHINTKPTNDIDSLIGQKIEFFVDSISPKKDSIVVSRRAYLEKIREEEKLKTLETIQEGQIREGIIKNITDYGVFIDLGGVDGLLHVSDISWGRVENPNQIFQPGQSVTVKVLSFDPEKQKISLGIKQLAEEPWLKVPEKYPVGTRVQGRVVGLTDYGAFVELEEGVEGLLHVSELSWTKRIRRASDILKIGDRIDAVVLKLDLEGKKISLGLKQIESNPWEELKEKFPEGTVIESKVKNVTDFGVFVELGEGIDGLVRFQDLSWSKRIKHPRELYKKGDLITAVVLRIDVENEKVSLGIKQLFPDPWSTATEKYDIGKMVSGKIVSITDFGIFVELEPGLEALLHETEAIVEKGKTLTESYNPNDSITAKIISMNINSKKIGLSLKKIKEDQEKSEIDSYKKSVDSPPNTLGSLLKKEMMRKEQENTSDKD